MPISRSVLFVRGKEANGNLLAVRQALRRVEPAGPGVLRSPEVDLEGLREIDRLGGASDRVASIWIEKTSQSLGKRGLGMTAAHAGNDGGDA